MVQRNLTDKEKIINENQIKRLEEELKHFDFLGRYEDMMIKEGCYWNYKQKLKTHKGLRKDVDSDININKTKIKVLKEQIEKGVEIKEKDEKASDSYIG